MASNQHPEAAEQTPAAVPNLQNITLNNVSQAVTQALFANPYSPPNEEAQEPNNQTHDQAQNDPLLLPITDSPPSTEIVPTTTEVQHPLEFHLYAPASANAIAVIPHPFLNAPIQVFIPAPHPPLSHTEFHIVPEHGDIANPRPKSLGTHPLDFASCLSTHRI